MKYIVACCITLLSLSTFASQQVNIDNQTKSNVIVYYTRDNLYQDHVTISGLSSKTVSMMTPSETSPQSLTFHWPEADRQKSFKFNKSINRPLIIKPAIVVSKHKYVIGSITKESYCSSDSSSEN